MADLIPLEVLLGNPEKNAPQISPDGERMAYLAPVDGVLNVWVGNIAKADYAPVTKDTDRGIREYAWAHNNRQIIYLQDEGGDENWRVYLVDLESGQTRDLTPFEGVQARIEHRSKQHPDDLLVGLNRDNPQLHDVYHCDLRTGELTKVAQNMGFLAWVVDHDMKVRGTVQPTIEGGINVLVRDGEDDDWRTFVEVPPDDALGFGLAGFTRDGQAMFLQSSVGANTTRLVRKDITSGAEEVIASDDTFDVAAVLMHPDTKEVQAVAFLKERLEWQVLDGDIAADFTGIQALHPDADLGFGGRDHADRTWVLNFDTDDGPVRFYAWDRDAQEATFLFVHRPELEDRGLVKIEPFQITARDGLELHGYLTFPADRREGLPTVLNVHGGPWARDTWGFDPEAQWLANRGYLCVQVNFRGSAGYGKRHLNAGDREWGGKMQDDLTDTVRWVIEQGYADPERVAIYGGSYGGYASLVGATFTPDLYACAVAIVGPSNLKTFIETIPPYWKPMEIIFHKRVGKPEEDEEFLWSRSPLSKVDQIGIPMLIGHGANDPRVKLAETEQIVEAMKEKGIDHQLIVFDDEGHGFAKPENRLRFHKLAEDFLAKHLGGRSEE